MSRLVFPLPNLPHVIKLVVACLTFPVPSEPKKSNCVEYWHHFIINHTIDFIAYLALCYLILIKEAAAFESIVNAILSKMNLLAHIIGLISLLYISQCLADNPLDGICLAEDSDALQVC